VATNTARPRVNAQYGHRIACSAQDGHLGTSCTPYRRAGCLYGRVRQRESTGVSVARLQENLGAREPVCLRVCELSRYIRKRGPPLWEK